MPCFHPRSVWRSARVLHKRTGKPRVFFRRPAYMFDRTVVGPPLRPATSLFDFYAPEEFQLPGCKPRCVGCQEIYSRSWAVRAWHESMRHEQNCFITLTYNDKFLPPELDHREWQLFMKRLRRSIDRPVSFFMAGEYGSQNFRPHFHACIFGYDFEDRKLWSVRDGVRLDVSEQLSKLWSDPKTGESFGFSSVGDVTFESAAYIARYVVKKIQRAEFLDGRKPEYSKCSLKRPIGKDWFLAFKDFVYPADSVSLGGGRKCKPPRYYDKVLELQDSELAVIIKSNRKDRARLSPDNSPERLRDREIVKQAQFSQLKRGSI